MNALAQLSPSALRKAADLKEQIESLQTELNRLLGPSVPVSESPGKRSVSPATREKMRKAQQERWAKLKGETTVPEPAPEAPGKRKLSPQAIANIRAGVAKREAKKKGQVAAGSKPKAKAPKSAAWKKALSQSMKARWAARKAAGQKTL